MKNKIIISLLQKNRTFASNAQLKNDYLFQVRSYGILLVVTVITMIVAGHWDYRLTCNVYDHDSIAVAIRNKFTKRD